MPPGGKISSVQVISETKNGVRILSLGPLQGIPKGSLGKSPAESSTLCHQHIWKRDGMRNKGLKKLKWESLEERMKVARLTLLHRTLNNQVAVSVTEYVKPQSCLKTRFSHPNKFVPLQSRSDSYKFNFWPRTIRDWNNLPNRIIEMANSNNFRNEVANFV